MTPGRGCPLHYRYSPSDLAHAPELAAETLYVIGGLYGNLPVATDFETSAGRCAVFNNGAAGMPNFQGTGYGVLTRIATQPAAHVETLYATRIADIWIEAIPVHYDQRRWLDAFRANWPPGSPAHASYHHRITQGPAFDIHQAARLTVSEHPERRPTAAILGRT